MAEVSESEDRAQVLSEMNVSFSASGRRFGVPTAEKKRFDDPEAEFVIDSRKESWPWQLNLSSVQT
jgi:hypothetical protein